MFVWRDLSLTGSGALGTARGRDIVRALAGHTVGHPNSAVYAVHDDPVTGSWERVRRNCR